MYKNFMGTTTVVSSQFSRVNSGVECVGVRLDFYRFNYLKLLKLSLLKSCSSSRQIIYFPIWKPEIVRTPNDFRILVRVPRIHAYVLSRKLSVVDLLLVQRATVIYLTSRVLRTFTSCQEWGFRFLPFTSERTGET